MLEFMRKHSIKIVWVIIIAFALSIGVISCTGRGQRGQAQRNQPRNTNTIATVDGKDIDVKLFLRFYNMGLMNFRDMNQTDIIDPKVDAYVAYEALWRTLDAQKQFDYAKRLKVRVSGREVNQQVNALKEAYNMQSKEDFNNLLAANGMKLKDLQQDIRQELTIAKLADTVKRGVTVTPQDVQNQFKKVRARHILVAFDRLGWEEKTVKDRQKLAGEMIANIYTQLVDGKDFAELALEYSDDKGTAVRGGDLGFFGVGTMVPEFEQTAFALEKDQTSKPFQTPYGYHIVQTLEIDQQEIPLDVDEKELQQQILAQRQNSALQQMYGRLQQEYVTEIYYPPFKAYDYKINGELDKALNIYLQLKAQSPQSPVPYVFTAEVYELQQKYDEALAEYERALLVQKLNPGLKFPYINFYRAALYAKQGKNALALSDLQAAEELVADNLNMLERIKDKYTELKSPALANRVDLKIKALEQSRIRVPAEEELDFE